MLTSHRASPGVHDRACFIPFPAIERHGVIGDRRTAALVASDGTVDWLCLPDYDGEIVLGALLDTTKGGHWKLGPSYMVSGKQSYLDDTMTLKTSWTLLEGKLVLLDAMAWPQTERSHEDEHRRVLIRHLRCAQGEVKCNFGFQPGYNFQRKKIHLKRTGQALHFRLGKLSFQVWTNAQIKSTPFGWCAEFVLKTGREIWAVLEAGPNAARWSAKSARRELGLAGRYWRTWSENIDPNGPGKKRARRSAMTVHLLAYAPKGSIVAAPVTSLPERIGGDWNADYRLSWVRDASLSMAGLAWAGVWKEMERYLHWLATLESKTDRPLHVLYGIHGETSAEQKELFDVSGYRGSRPVRIGNHAYKQVQRGAVGFLADCVLIFLGKGGKWRSEYWNLIERIAEYTAGHWRQRGNGIWELSAKEHFTSSRVMSWVVLDRAIQIAQKVNRAFDTARWERARAAIHKDVLRYGWSKRLRAFRQCYGKDNLDAAELLISVFDFLPARDSRVLATIQRVEERLTIDGFVYRFLPRQTPGFSRASRGLGEMEGAFLPCTFWLATALAKAGLRKRAEAILDRVEKISGELGLFAEAVDPRTQSFLGNTPLLFSHVEHIRALTALFESSNR